MIKIQVIIFLVFLLLSACDNNFKDKENCLCQLDDDSLIILKGTINIDIQDNIVFEKTRLKNNFQRKTLLIPCSNDLKDYIFKCYNSYLYIKKFDEKFWISVSGKYITGDTLNELPKFLFNWVALIDKGEALTDSSQALRETTREQNEKLIQNDKNN